MKALLSLVLIVALVCTLTPSIYAGPTNQVMQGTQIRLTPAKRCQYRCGSRR